MKEIQGKEYLAEPGQQTFLSSTIQELENIVSLLGSNNDKLDHINNKAGIRNYEESCKSSGDIKKSSETIK